MKNKSFLLLSVILIAFVVVTSYTPNVVQAETPTQDQPVSSIQSDKEQVSSAGDSDALTDVDTPNVIKNEPLNPEGDNHVNDYIIVEDFFNAVGINFVPHDSRLTYYNSGSGCLGTSYAGDVAKTFTIPVNLPSLDDGFSQGHKIYFTYRNKEEDPWPSIYVTLFRRYYSDLTTQKMGEWRLSGGGIGYQYEEYDISNIEFDTSLWLYWLEFRIQQDGASEEREFCGVQIAYTYNLYLPTPPLFPLAFPTVITKP